MFKLLYTGNIALLVLLAVVAAEPLRFRANTQSRFFARQETAPLPSPAPTGYPQAGVTPDVPFELPNEQSTTAQPNVSYLPPDNTYGPPDNTYGPPAVATTPDNTYIPPVATKSENTPPTPAIEDPESAEDAEIPQPQPDVKVQPVDVDAGDVIVEVAEDGSVIAVSTSFDQDTIVNEKPARLVYQRFPQPHRERQRERPPTSEAFVERRPARLLTLRQVVAPARLQVLQQQQLTRTFAYTPQF